MAKITPVWSSSSITDPDKVFKGWLCKCGHIRGLHRVTAGIYYFGPDEDEDNNSRVKCECGCDKYKAMTNLDVVQMVDKKNKERNAK